MVLRMDKELTLEEIGLFSIMVNIPEAKEATAEYDDEENFDDEEDFFFADESPAECFSKKNDKNFEELNSKIDFLTEAMTTFVQTQAKMNDELISSNKQLMTAFLPSFQNLMSVGMSSENCTHINTDNINTKNTLSKNHINQSNTTVRTNGSDGIDRIDRCTTAPMSDISVYEKYEQIIKDNIRYDDFVLTKKDYQLKEIDKIVDIMTETVAFNTAPISINGSLIPAEVVKSRFLKVKYGDIEYVLESLAHKDLEILENRITPT